MKLTREECIQSLMELTPDPMGIYIGDVMMINQLIKEHFELVEEYKDCRRELDGFYHSMSNPPLKFEELKEGMWVWYDIMKEYIKITETIVWSDGFKSVCYLLDQKHEVGVAYSENSFYAREVK